MINTAICFSCLVVSIFSIYHQIKLMQNMSLITFLIIFELLWALYYTFYVTGVICIASATTRAVSGSQMHQQFFLFKLLFKSLQGKATGGIIHKIIYRIKSPETIASVRKKYKLSTRYSLTSRLVR